MSEQDGTSLAELGDYEGVLGDDGSDENWVFVSNVSSVIGYVA